MGWPQVTIAIGLLLNTVFVLWGWLRFRFVTAHHITLPRYAMVFRQTGWTAALIPITEAWVLRMGGFF